LRQKKNYGFKPLLALALAAALLSAGPGSPVTTFASNGDDEGYYDDSYYDDEDYYEDESYYDDSANDEATYTGATSATTKLLDELYAEQDQIESNIESLKTRQKELEAGIAGARNEKEQAIAERDGLAYQISIKTELITAQEEKIRILGEEIELRQLYIEEKQAEIDANFRLLQKRLGAMYMQDDGTMLGLMIGADDFTEFLTRSEYTVLVNEHDQNLLQELTDQRIGIEEEKAAREVSKAQQEEEQATLEKEKADLAAMHAKAAQQVQDINIMEQEYMANLAANKAKQDAAQAELDDVFQRIEWSKNPYSGGVMAWPVPGFSTISSTYGWRFSGNDFHTGMDITGNGDGRVNGAPIVAAADGVVKMVNTSYTQGTGYGIYLIIDHGVNGDGQSVSTLYGHCSALLVSLGQEVKRGEAVAQVGSTGWSTGPHLHFEVRLDGKHTEPSQYLQ
jgi:murein DD-endopeptidase MepM/ murein hydrolase activator NlpD